MTRTALTPTERQILSAFAQGMTAQEAADARGVSIKTVKSHLGTIYRKIGARNRTHAVAIAIRGGIIR